MESSSSNNGGLGLLFRLPRKIRDNIYQRVLVIRHPLYLFTDGPHQKVELFAPEKPAQWLALLHTNRQLHAEAAATLYGSHQFVMVDTTQNQVNLLQSFLDLIGSVNAGYLRHICIKFPVVVTASENVVCDRTGPEHVTSMLQEEDLRGLTLIQERCRGLTTLETDVHSKNSKGLVAAAAGQGGGISPHTRMALAEVEAQLKAIPLLEKVIIRLYNGPLAPEVAGLIQSFGWVVLPGR
jgi:hypothetical protein